MTSPLPAMHISPTRYKIQDLPVGLYDMHDLGGSMSKVHDVHIVLDALNNCLDACNPISRPAIRDACSSFTAFSYINAYSVLGMCPFYCTASGVASF